MIVSRAGIDTLDGSKPATSVVRLGEPTVPTCWVIEEEAEPASEETTTEGTTTEETPAASTEGAAAAEQAAGEEAVEEPAITYACQDIEPDFVQRPLPVNICDDPSFRGSPAKVVVEFDETGWLRRLVTIEAEEGAVDALTAAIRDWRIVPVEVAEGTLARVRFTVEFPLEIPCR